MLLVITVSSEAVAAPLKVGIPVKDSEPFVIQEGEKLDGMIVDIWEKIAQEKAIEYEWVPQDNYDLAVDAGEFMFFGLIVILVSMIMVVN